ncbi:hypothetical protein AVEN_35324-1 [Araneus ventricosus]|uniref:Uncharacterized protein n=1 Tax=Araneus ventricosus TaxID=182803 RepID=A0A4Y2RGB3_ARAVE|nr:hypothetical protein AVEN_35324-1 [Araneus ventricosus]
MGNKRFGSDEELENAVATWLNELAAEEYDMGILKLVDRYDKCVNLGGARQITHFCALAYHREKSWRSWFLVGGDWEQSMFGFYPTPV